MQKLYKELYSPIFSLFLFAIGGGLLNTLLVLRLHLEDVSSSIIGLMTALFYLGLVAGSFKIEKLIVRVGHIRAFSAFASILTVAVLIHAIYFNIYLWLFLRVVCGFATAGLYVVIEGWLLTIGEHSKRGTMLAIYMLSLYMAQALGQVLVKFNNMQSNILFILIAIVCALSVIPLSLTQSRAPVLHEPSALSFRKIYHLTKTGVIACLCAGLIMSSLYGLFPLYIIKQTNNSELVALGMFLLIFGGMIFQYPVGRLSDLVERRKILFMLCLAVVIFSLVLLFLFDNKAIFYLSVFCLGGSTFTLYPIGISHACDALDHKDITSGTQALLLAYSIGAVTGPLIAPVFMYFMGAQGFFIYVISVVSFLAYFVSLRKVLTGVVLNPEEPFVNVTTTTPVIMTMDPRGDARE